MKLSFLVKLEYISLRSKVAKRIFFLFILCALVPLLALAFFSFRQVSEQLRIQAEEHLHQTCKATGLTIFERLAFLETDLETIVVHFNDTALENPITISDNTIRRLANRFEFLALSSEDGHFINFRGSGELLPELNASDREHLRKGKTVIKTVHRDRVRPDIYMAKAVDANSTGHKMLYGRINPVYLWGGKGSFTLIMNTFVIDESDNILFSSSLDYVPVTELRTSLASSPSTGTFEWSSDGSSFLGSYWTLFVKHQFNVKWLLVHSQDRSEILQPLDYFKKIFLLVIILTFLVVLSLSINQIRKSLIPIEILQKATHRVAKKDFGSHVQIDSSDEFEELGNSFNDMVDSIAGHIKVMKTINKIGLKLSAEKDTYRLLQSILNGARSITNADGYALYAVTEDKKLKLSIMAIDSLDRVKGSSGQEAIPLYDKDANPNINNVAAFTVLEDKTVNIPDIYAEKEFDFSYNYALDREIGYQSLSFLSVPLKDHENEIVGVLQLINARDKNSGGIIPFTDDDRRLVETLASQAGVALSKNRLVQDMKELFDDLVELISKAIDEKSPYTGGHSRRVSDLTMILAEAVSNKKDGPYKSISFTKENMYELKIASLLHDCGKITTPVHVMDKSSKLETIFDRMNLIDARFEILKRDKLIALLNGKLPAWSNNENSESSGIKEELAKFIEQLEKDRSFIRDWNSGGSVMPDNAKRTMEEIAVKYRWIDADNEEKPLLTDDELYNLTVTQGTITPEERNVLNNHIILTIRMLESLSYPKALKNVPRYVATHHERWDGSGYPNGLRGDEIPLQGKILALADVFEALIAKDRPYKKGKTVAEALSILGTMKVAGQIDPDLFDIFISEKVYLKYAETHLPPEQLGNIVPSEIPGFNPMS